MIEFLKDILIRSFLEGPLGIVCGLLAWILLLFLLTLIVFGVLYLLDYSFRPVIEGLGMVISKTFIPEHNETTWVYNLTLKCSTPQTTHYPDEWKLQIKVYDSEGDISVSENIYKRVKNGDSLKVKYSYGRIFGTLYIKEVL